MTDKTNGKKVVDTLGYTPEQYKLFTKNAWIVLLAFSLLYSILYCGRLNLQYTMPAMMAEEGWTELDLGILSSVLFWTYGIGHLFNGRLGEIFGAVSYTHLRRHLSGKRYLRYDAVPYERDQNQMDGQHQHAF